MHHFVAEICTCVHISVTKWCIVGYLPYALWGCAWICVSHVRNLVPRLNLFTRDFLLCRHQANTWTNVDSLSTGPLGTNLKETIIKMQYLYSRKCTRKCPQYVGENVVRNISAILLCGRQGIGIAVLKLPWRRHTLFIAYNLCRKRWYQYERYFFVSVAFVSMKSTPSDDAGCVWNQETLLRLQKCDAQCFNTWEIDTPISGE